MPWHATPAETVPSPTGQRKRTLIPRLVIRGLTGGACVAFALGFVGFAERVSTPAPAQLPKADAIVALTGGTDRVADAMALLAAGQGARVLITGVNPGTNVPELIELHPQYRHLFACCVDLGYEAQNTIGNAQEAADWVEGHTGKMPMTQDHMPLQSLIVVTSAYHMPRALAEMRLRLPAITLYPFPVVPDRLRGVVWWRDVRAAQLIGREYVKYLVAMVRIHLFDTTILAPTKPHAQTAAK